jgi:hypothetical protein
VSHDSECGVRSAECGVNIPSRTLNPMLSQSIVLTGGGGKTILIDFEEGSDAGIKKGKDKEMGGTRR